MLQEPGDVHERLRRREAAHVQLAAHDFPIKRLALGEQGANLFDASAQWREVRPTRGRLWIALNSLKQNLRITAKINPLELGIF